MRAFLVLETLGASPSAILGPVTFARVSSSQLPPTARSEELRATALGTLRSEAARRIERREPCVTERLIGRSGSDCLT